MDETRTIARQIIKYISVPEVGGTLNVLLDNTSLFKINVDNKQSGPVSQEQGQLKLNAGIHKLTLTPTSRKSKP